MEDSSKGASLIHLQIDLKQLPPIITNRVLKRCPLCIYYIQQHLMRRRGMQAGSGVDHIPAVQSCNVCEESQSGLQCNTSVSGRHFEDPLPVVSYTRARGGLQRSQTLDDDQMRE